MFYIIGQPKSLYDLEGTKENSVGLLRKQTRIAIIDDEAFINKNSLLQHDYQVKELGDIIDINAVKDYQIILCDIHGVGKHFNSKYEGGHIIEEITKYYPNKIVIAYTGERFDPTFNKFFQLADASLKKDADIDEWQSILDESLIKVNSPSEQWKKTRDRLLTLNVPYYILIKLEDKYVESILKKKNLLSKNAFVDNLNSEAKSIIKNLVTGFLLKSIGL